MRMLECRWEPPGIMWYPSDKDKSKVRVLTTVWCNFLSKALETADLYNSTICWVKKNATNIQKLCHWQYRVLWHFCASDQATCYLKHPSPSTPPPCLSLAWSSLPQGSLLRPHVLAHVTPTANIGQTEQCFKMYGNWAFLVLSSRWCEAVPWRKGPGLTLLYFSIAWHAIQFVQSLEVTQNLYRRFSSAMRKGMTFL